jgi:hypothetical protein
LGQANGARQGKSSPECQRKKTGFHRPNLSEGPAFHNGQRFIAIRRKRQRSASLPR